MIILRRWNIDDASDLFEYASDPLTAESAAWNVHQSIEDSCKVLEHYIKSDEVWAIDINSKAVGCIGLHRRADGFSRMLEYVVNKNYRGRGIASDSVRAAVKYAFCDLHMNYITANCYADNTASEKVLLKCGFTFIKTLKNSRCDIKHYRLEKADFLNSLELYDTNAVFK